MGKLLPALLVLLGLGAGGGVGYLLRPAAPEPPAETPGETVVECAVPDTGGHVAEAAGTDEGEGEEPTVEYVKLNNQFVVPILEGQAIRALVILSLSLEVGAGNSEKVFQQEPKLRDEFLRVLFDHANTGGFDGAFTASGRMEGLRAALVKGARMVLGDTARGVLILDIIRQDA